MSKAKNARAKKAPPSDKKHMRMQVVLSATCEACPTPCARGIRYRERMRQAGAVGKGVPCILTRTYI